jgi:hypothetical protein
MRPLQQAEQVSRFTRETSLTFCQNEDVQKAAPFSGTGLRATTVVLLAGKLMAWAAPA